MLVHMGRIVLSPVLDTTVLMAMNIVTQRTEHVCKVAIEDIIATAVSQVSICLLIPNVGRHITFI